MIRAITTMICLMSVLTGCETAHQLVKRPFQAAGVLVFGPPKPTRQAVVVRDPEPASAPPAVGRPSSGDFVQPALETGLQAFAQCRYEMATRLLDEAASISRSTLAERAKAYLYAGVARYYLGQEAEARVRFKAALQWQPAITPPRDEFTPEVVDLFEKVRAGQ